MFCEPRKFAMSNRCPSAKELATILLSENSNVYHFAGVLQGSAFAGKIALDLKTILRSTLCRANSLVSECQAGPLQAWVTYQALAVTLAQKTADM